MIGLTVGATWVRASQLPAVLAVEIMAQAAALLVDAGPTAATPGYLAGLEGIEMLSPLMAGDQLLAEATLERRFGALVKVQTALRRGDELVAQGGLLLGTGT